MCIFFAFSPKTQFRSDTMVEEAPPSSLISLCIDHLANQLLFGIQFSFPIYIDWILQCLWNYNLKFWNCFRGRWSYCYYSSYIWTSITFAWWFDFTFNSSCIVSFPPSHVRLLINSIFVNDCLSELLSGS